MNYYVVGGSYITISEILLTFFSSWVFFWWRRDWFQ